MTPEQFLAKCEAAFQADEPQVIPASVARAMFAIVAEVVTRQKRVGALSWWAGEVEAFESACKEIEA